MADIIEKGEKRKSIGELNQELASQTPATDDARELQEEIQGDSYESQFLEAMARGMQKYHRDFYLVTINQRFRLFSNVVRTYFIDRLSCPTPDFDQNVYLIERKTGNIIFLWSIPDKNTCGDMYSDPLGFPDQKELVQFVYDFYDGTLLEKAKKLNAEDKADLVISN